MQEFRRNGRAGESTDDLVRSERGEMKNFKSGDEKEGGRGGDKFCPEYG